MNKFVLVSILPIVFTFNVIACSSGVDMTVPHIHDENDFLVSVENAQKNELKKMDIYQVLAGKIKKKSHDTHLIAQEVKWSHLSPKVN